MLYICALCRVISRKSLVYSAICQVCYPGLDRLRLEEVTMLLSAVRSQHSVVSLYSYEGLIRELVLNAKVRNEWGAVKACQYLVMKGEQVESYMKNVRGVIPAPSSMRSRIMGKYDLAFFIAEALSRKFQCPLYNLPKRFYWRFKKQSLIPREIREKNGKLLSLGQLPGLRRDPRSSLLIVDDVMTTGSTVASIIENKNLNGVKILTFASAFNRGIHD